MNPNSFLQDMSLFDMETNQCLNYSEEKTCSEQSKCQWNPDKKLCLRKPVTRLEYWMTKQQLEVLSFHTTLRDTIDRLNNKILEQERRLEELEQKVRQKSMNVVEHQRVMRNVKYVEDKIKSMVEKYIPPIQREMEKEERKFRRVKKGVKEIQSCIRDDLKQYVLAELLMLDRYTDFLRHHAVLKELNRKFHYLEAQYANWNKPSSSPSYIQMEKHELEKELQNTVRDIRHTKHELSQMDEKLHYDIREAIRRVIEKVQNEITEKELKVYVLNHTHSIHIQCLHDLNVLTKELSNNIHAYKKIKGDMVDVQRGIFPHVAELVQQYTRLKQRLPNTKKTKECILELYSGVDLSKKPTRRIGAYIRQNIPKTMLCHFDTLDSAR